MRSYIPWQPCCCVMLRRDYVLTGRHHVPLFKGVANTSSLDEFKQDLPEKILSSRQWVERTSLVSDEDKPGECATRWSHGLCTRDLAALTLVVAMITVMYQLLSCMLLLRQKGAALVVDVFDAHYKIHEIPNGIEVIANRNYLYMSRV